MSDRFIAHMLSRNIRTEEDLIDQLFNSSEKRLARALTIVAGALRQAGHAGSRGADRLPGNLGGHDWHDAFARELLHEQVQASRAH